MTNDIVHLWAVRSREVTPGPDPDEPDYDYFDFQDVVLYYEEARAKEVASCMKQKPRFKYVGITELAVPAGHVCWIYEEYHYHPDCTARVCSAINISSYEEWCVIWERYEEALYADECPSIKPVKLSPVW